VEETFLMGRWIFAGLIALAVTIGIVAYRHDGDWSPDDGWRQGNAQVVTTQDGQTIVVERDRHFSPFFLFFPFFIFGLIWLIGPWRWRNNGWRGPGPGQGSEWMNEWHRRQHEQSPNNP
jgi:hypothetical protein